MSGQLESHHFFRFGDTVRSPDGSVGVVAEAWTLFAIVRWENGRQDEIEQFDPEVVVVQRQNAEGF